MNEFFIKIFGTTTGSAEITLFSIWHFLYIFLILGASFGAYFLLRKKSDKAKTTTLNILAYFFINKIINQYPDLSHFTLFQL